MNARRSAPSRVVLVDKPADWTSFDVVRVAKRHLRGKIGHAGTLDPFATGLLLVLTGQATRVSSLLMDLPKEYLVTARFGAVSTTGDPTGSIEHTGGKPSADEILTALDAFRGRLRQRVPMTSAVKVGGERLYEKVRRGEEVETPERDVVVYDASLLGYDGEAKEAGLLFRTGKGTYVRRLVEDLGEAVGSGAYAASLRRLSSGPFRVDAAVGPLELTADRLVGVSAAVRPLDDALGFLPRHRVGGADVKRAANGNQLSGTPAGRFRVVGPDGLMAIYQGVQGVSRPLVVFPAPQE